MYRWQCGLESRREVMNSYRFGGREHIGYNYREEEIAQGEPTRVRQERVETES